jgi:maltose alpha-D-glucosyltransferase/alpha-amylase
MSEWGYPTRAIGAGFHVDFWLAFFLPGYAELFRRERARALVSEVEGHSFFDRDGRGDVTVFLQNYVDQHRATAADGFIALPTGNHDVSRLSVGRSARDLAVIFAFVLTMPGVPFIYYGDEIGMRYERNVPSKEGGYHRTGSRTPMQWGGGRNAGFSSTHPSRLYLPIDRRGGRPTVEGQQAAPRSLLNTVRRLIALRASHPALQAAGDLMPLFARPDGCPLVYLRRLGEERVLVALNPSATPVCASFAWPEGRVPNEVLMSSGRVRLIPRGPRMEIEMGGRSFAIAAIRAV